MSSLYFIGFSFLRLGVCVLVEQSKTVFFILNFKCLEVLLIAKLYFILQLDKSCSNPLKKKVEQINCPYTFKKRASISYSRSHFTPFFFLPPLSVPHDQAHIEGFLYKEKVNFYPKRDFEHSTLGRYFFFLPPLHNYSFEKERTRVCARAI